MLTKEQEQILIDIIKQKNGELGIFYFVGDIELEDFNGLYEKNLLDKKIPNRPGELINYAELAKVLNEDGIELTDAIYGMSIL